MFPKLLNYSKNIENLIKSGFNTIDWINSSVSTKNNPYNSALNDIPLLDVLKYYNFTHLKNNTYKSFDKEITIKDNKWFSITDKKGNINSISLAKYIISLKENIPLDDPNILKAVSYDLNKLIYNTNNLKETSNQENKKDLFSAPTKLELKDIVSQANLIPLEDLFEKLGSNPNEDGQLKWKLWETGENVAITNHYSWYSWNSLQGGIGAINFLIYYFSITKNIPQNETNNKTLFKLALNYLQKEFSDYFDSNHIIDLSVNNSTVVYKKPFSMPLVLDLKLNKIKEYLNKQRFIPLWIINKQINEGLLFAGFPSDWIIPKNINSNSLSDDNVWATFLSINGEAAEMRAISRTDEFSKLLASGSNKELGGFLIKPENDCNTYTVSALEASIDCLSYHVFYPGKASTSCMGVNFNLATQAALETLSRTNWNFELCFDNDLAGNEATIKFKHNLIEDFGEETVNTLISSKRLQFFDLSVRCLKESIKEKTIFYFDVLNNDIGKEAVLLFQQQLKNHFSNEEIKEFISSGLLKYINISPNFSTLNSSEQIENEVNKIYSLLSSGKPFYLRLDTSDDSTNNEKLLSIKKSFEKSLFEKNEKLINQWIFEGKIINSKKAIAKDWNEYLIYMSQKPDFKNYLKTQNDTYKNYLNFKKPNSKSI